MIRFLAFWFMLATLSVGAEPESLSVHPDLELVKLQESVYLHRSWLETESFGRVSCNGLVVISEGEALVIDTAATEELSRHLIEAVERHLEAQVSAVVIGHFHADSMGGLPAFEAVGATSFSSLQTQEIARSLGSAVPRVGFDLRLQTRVGSIPVELGYFGPGHTLDNIVTYLPEQKILFGGCLLKAQGAGFGNLEDAAPSAWSATVERLKKAYPEVKFVVPGHGDLGGSELLDYTIELFEPAARDTSEALPCCITKRS